MSLAKLQYAWSKNTIKGFSNIMSATYSAFLESHTYIAHVGRDYHAQTAGSGLWSTYESSENRSGQRSPSGM